ncbi:MAG: hypothetical protein [Caudoviricetes sp.]|nr:MAG: hypothetical protein [Caudoviricetes sp.]
MAQLVYGLFDNESGGLHMFSTPNDVLAKDAVMAFLELHVMKDWEDELLVEHKKDIQTAISGATSPQDLVRILIGFGFILNILAV